MENSSRKPTITAAAAAMASMLLFSPTVSASVSSSRRRTRSTVNAARHDDGVSNKERTDQMRRSDKQGDAPSLVPAFSCGSVWTEATQCSMMCPTGDGCPDGQECFAGIPCPSAMVKENEMRSRIDLETESAEEEYQSIFSCGRSYAHASEMCSSPSSAQLSPSLLCPGGLSDECPFGMNCYAAVRCPRMDLRSDSSQSYVDETILSPSQTNLSLPVLIPSYFDYEALQVKNSSSYVNQPMLINTTMEQDTGVPSRVGTLAHGSCLL